MHTHIRTHVLHAVRTHVYSSEGAANLSKLNVSPELAEGSPELAEGSSELAEREGELFENESCTDSEATVAYNEKSVKA